MCECAAIYKGKVSNTDGRKSIKAQSNTLSRLFELKHGVVTLGACILH